MKHLQKLLYSAILLAIALLLPFLTGQLPEIGSMLLPMHLPVLLAGFLCGGGWGAAVGFIAPLLRSAIFGMPVMYPMAVAMALELAAYGFFSGLLYKYLPHKKWRVFVALPAAMVIGRVVFGLAFWLLTSVSGGSYSWAAFIGGTVTSGIPGIVIQLVLIPVLVLALEKTGRFSPKDADSGGEAL